MKDSNQTKIDVLQAVKRAINDERETEGKASISENNILKALRRAISSKDTLQTIAYHDHTVKGFGTKDFTKKEIFEAVNRAIKASYESDGKNMYSDYKMHNAIIVDGKLLRLRKEVALVPEDMIEIIPPTYDDEE